MKIDKIKKTGKKYKITLDNGKEIATYEDVILDNGLLFHRFINDKLYKKIIEDTKYFQSYNKVLDMISRRLRSEYEVLEYLKKSEIEENDIKNIIDNLKKIGLIDDIAYAKAYTNDKINLSFDGPYKIKKNLVQNKIDESIIHEVIENIDRDILHQHIDKIIDKKVKSNTKYTSNMLKQKIIIYLVNLGYSKDMVVKRLDRKEIKNPNLKKEMDKVLNKLKKKYDGDKLIFNLKGKLYSKGYTREEIEEYIKDSSLFWAIFIWWLTFTLQSRWYRIVVWFLKPIIGNF